jgi:SAM-dependent methyltransferase
MPDEVQHGIPTAMSSSIAVPHPERVGRNWSKKEPLNETTGGFLYSPITRPYIIETAFGHDAVEPYRRSFTWAWDILVDRYLRGRRVHKVLSLCCGSGVAERILMPKLPEVTECRALDIAPGDIATAERLANEAGIPNIRYEVADLNAYAWEDSRYDLVIADGALHHIKNLEGVVAGVRKTLKPGGLFFSCECVGPNYQDHPPRQLELINAAAFLIPAELRARTGLRWQRHPRIFRALTRLYTAASREDQPSWPEWKKLAARTTRAVVRRREFDFGVVHISPKSHNLRTDPSECVRSADVLPVVEQTFPGAEIRPMGGGLLEYALDQKFYERFDENNERHRSGFKLVCDMERHYMATGEIGNDFAFIIASRE